jgi:protein O-GlcNAc transferase
MTQFTLDQAMQSAVRHQQSGRLAEAEKLCRLILSQYPKNGEALQLLGMLAAQTGHLDVAVQLVRQAVAAEPARADYHCNLGKLLRDQRKLDESVAACREALRLRPEFPEAYNNLGIALKDQAKLDEAIAAYRRALQLRPDFPEVCSNLGNALKDQGSLGEAVAAYQQALSLKPDYAMAHNNLGIAFSALKRYDEAIASYEQALRLKPEFPEARNNLSIVLRDQGKLDQALASCREALRLRPNYPEAHSNLGNTLRDQGKLDEAVAAYRQAVALRPNFAPFRYNLGNVLRDQARLDEAIAEYHAALRIRPDYTEVHNNLGAALKDQAKLDEAIAAYQQALRLRPDFPDALGNLGNAMKDIGKLDEALSCYDRAVELKPHDPRPDNNRIYTMQFHPRYDAAAIFREQRAWNERRAKPLTDSIDRHENHPSADRRLRIGYVSAYFCAHAEAFFVLPLLEAHNHEHFEIHCYSSVLRPDELTERHRRAADVWHDVRGLPDADLARRIRADKIDILVDLAMHMAESRLLAFARKPAPVQATWLAYPGGTGLDTMDYRFIDPHIEPSLAQPCHVEKSIALPDCWCCYDPLTDVPPAAARGGGAVCFGSTNNPCKLNEPLLRLWARIMAAAPDSRLLLQTFSSEHSDRIRRVMSQAGIVSTRLDFVGRAPRASYLRLYDGIDICLDPLPYNGITTTLDALWMGVPVVSLAGQTAAGRAGLSILSAINLTELAAQTPDQFVKIAADLAVNPARRTEMRSTLRGKLKSSPLMDSPRFASAMEAAYRQMWRQWCSGS